MVNPEPAAEIHEAVSSTRKRAKLLFIANRFAWATTSMVLCVASLVAIDWWLRSNADLYRWAISLVAVGSCTTVAYRCLVPVFRWRLTNLQTAWMIERSYPELRGRLSSAMSFFDQSQMTRPVAQGVSDALVARSLEDTSAQLNAVDWRRLLTWERLWMASGSVMLVALGAASLSLFAPVMTTIGLTRLANPNADVRWPLRYELQFSDIPLYAAVNEPLVLSVQGRSGRLPRRVCLQVRDDAANETSTFYAYSADGLVEFEWIPDAPQISVRATGGDGDTGWKTIIVTERPKLEVSELVAIPPECLELAPITTNDGLVAPKGSMWRWRGTASQPLASAQLKIVEASKTSVVELEFSDPDIGLNLASSSPIDLNEAAEYQIQMVAETGLRGESVAYELTPQFDLPPSIEMTVDELRSEGSYYVRRGQQVQLQIRATDDFGWSLIEIETGQEQETQSDVWETLWSATRPEIDAMPMPQTKRSAYLQLGLSLTETEQSPTGGHRPLRAICIDGCGHRGESRTEDVHWVDDETYRSVVETEYRRWKESIRPIQIELSALTKRPLSSSRGQNEQLDRVSLGIWLSRIRKLETSLTNGDAAAPTALYQLLARAEPLATPQWEASQELRALAAQWQGEFEPKLLQLSLLLRELGSIGNRMDPSETNLGERQRQRETASQCVLLHAELLQLVESWIGSEAQFSSAEVWNRVEQISTVQRRLRQDVVDWQFATPSAIGQLDRAADFIQQQRRLANEVERLQSDVTTFLTKSSNAARQRSAPRLREFSTTAISVWQREAAQAIAESKLGPATESQAKALELLDAFLPTPRDQQQDEKSAEERRAWLRSARDEAERLADTIPVLAGQLESNAGQRKKQSLLDELTNLLAELQAKTNSFGDLPATQEVVQQAVRQLESAKTALDQNDIFSAADAAGRAADVLGSEINDDPSVEQSENAQIQAALERWRAIQQLLTENLGWLSSTPADTIPDATWQRLALTQQRLADEVVDTVAERKWQEIPLLVWELEEIAREMARLSEEIGPSVSMTRLIAASDAVVRRLSLLETAHGNSDESGTTANDEDSTEESGDEPARPAGWDLQLAVLRASQIRILGDTEQRFRDLVAKGLERPPVDDLTIQSLYQRQETLRLRAEELQKLAETALNNSKGRSNEMEGATELPGLGGPAGVVPSDDRDGDGEDENLSGGLPGLPLGNSSRPSTNDPNSSSEGAGGEDVGQGPKPLESVILRMEFVRDGFAQGQIGPENQDAQRIIIEMLTPPESPNEESSGSNPKQNENSTSAGQESPGSTGVAELGSLTPNALMGTPGIWGHLPEQLQIQIEAFETEAWVPGFEQMSIEYFRSLDRQWEREGD